MALPKIDLPLFELIIPSTNKKIFFRPFSVKEEKILLMAKESRDIDQIVLAIKQIITNCTKGVDVEKLALFDLEYMMMNIRGKSVNEELSFKIKDPETEEEVKLVLNINEIKVTKNPDHNKVIQINDQYSIAMRYPTLNELKLMTGDESKKQESIFNVMISCIESIVDGDQVIKLSDNTPTEVTEFVESLSSKTVSQIQKFFETIPVLRIECPYVTKAGKSKTFVIQGVESFFI